MSNSTALANIGPTYAALSHQPVVPPPLTPITVSVQASDPDGVMALTLYSAKDGGAWSSAPMTNPRPGRYTGSIAGQPAGTVIHSTKPSNT